MTELISGILLFVGGLCFGVFLAIMRERSSAYQKRRATFEKQAQEAMDRIDQVRDGMMGGKP